MDPSETWIGKVLVVGLVLMAIAGASALLSAKGEVARRVRLVLGIAILLGLGAITLAVAGPSGLAIVLVVGGAITWIIKGARK